VALRSRQVHFRLWPALLKGVLMRFVREPLNFLVPPKSAAEEKIKD
jgi:site-specific recombinase